MAVIDLRDDWNDLLQRRGALATSLVPYGPIIDAWAQWAPPDGAPAWERRHCEASWRRGVPLLAEWPPALAPQDVEDLVAIAMEAVTAVRPEEAPAMRRLADEWDTGRLG